MRISRSCVAALALCCLPAIGEAQETRLSNVSVRTAAGGADTLITGFTIGPGAAKQVLVRAVGPTLGAFGVSDTLADPKLELYNSSGVKIVENDNFNPADAPVFATVGAFALNAGARDAALVIALSPGSYTAQVSGIAGASGIALVEVYEIGAGATRLINLSTRAQVGTGSDILIPGITIAPGTGTRRLLLRAVGPTLGSFGVPGTLGDPKLELYSGATKTAENDNWSTPISSAAADAGALAAAFAQSGAFALPAGSRDAALLINLGAGSYTIQVSGAGNTTGTALVEIYDLSPAFALPVISAQPQSLALTAGAPATLSGTATRGPAVTYQWLKDGTPLAGAQSATLTLPSVQTASAGGYSVVVTNAGGSITSETATLVVRPNQTGAKPSASLYVAQLRPDPAATGSTASGYATILINPDGTAFVNVTFTNLTSAQTSGHLLLGASRDFVFNLPRGQVTAAFWTFEPSGAFTTNDLINALNTGNIFVGLDSAKFPDGELRGNFIPATGSQTFIAPAAPPPLAANALTAPTQTDAARFLTQATFGPTTATINALMARGINGWIDDQMALPATGAKASTRADVAAFPNPTVPLSPTDPLIRFLMVTNWHAAWWKMTIAGPDQLRQRVAFALSEILVVGNHGQTEAKVKYYDILINHAFGNYRQLLEEITLNPVMADWLTYLKNQKADPVRGTAPDENYAREVQQLFSIGLVQLQPDGTLLLDTTGQPIPTYNQAMISETAKVFTGWSFSILPATTTNEGAYRGTNPPDTVANNAADDNAWFLPMRHFDAFHDKTQKSVVSLQQVPLAEAKPTIIPAGQTGPQDLKMMLDTLFNHPNTGPFICRQLIQRLVTSNPSPGYVYRVAQVFANDGTGTRGNLGAVVRAILTDYEARSPDVLGNFGYGKIKEPLLRFTAFFRALHAAAPNGRYLDNYFLNPANYQGTTPFNLMAFPIDLIGQAPLYSPTVFNFFSPTYSPPGAMAAAGLVAPEMEITDSNYAIRVPNEMVNFMYRNPASLVEPPTGPSPFIVLDYSALLPDARNPAALVDQLNLLFCANQMSAGTRTSIIASLQALPSSATDRDRVQTALHFTIISPDGALQK